MAKETIKTSKSTTVDINLRTLKNKLISAIVIDNGKDLIQFDKFNLGWDVKTGNLSLNGIIENKIKPNTIVDIESLNENDEVILQLKLK